jgi:hypothetical protein
MMTETMPEPIDDDSASVVRDDSANVVRIDYDGAWKEALEQFLRPFLEFSFPRVARQIDWSVDATFLDKELQKVVRDADLGTQRVDKLVKVQRHDGQPEWVLLHVEVQSWHDPDLPLRLYRYHHRIADRWRMRVATLAVLGSPRRQRHRNVYEEEIWGCRVRFEYPVSILADFDEGALESDPNPFSIVAAAHLAARRSGGNMNERASAKWRITRRLYDRGYTRQQVLDLFRLIDWLLRLPDGLESRFRRDLTRLEEDTHMPYITSIERMGREEGRQEGREEGRQEGREEGRQDGAARLVLRLARKRFPAFTADDEAAVRTLELERLESLNEALLDFESLEDLRGWVGGR